MSVEQLEFGHPFFEITAVRNEAQFALGEKQIVVNLSSDAIVIEAQTLEFLSSCIVCNTTLQHVQFAILINGFDTHDDEALFHRVKQAWPLAFDVRKEERLRGVEHYMGPKIRLGNIGLGLYHAGSVPLNVGLHKFHPWCETPGFKEVHTQIVGYGKMQQCREQNIDSLYLEETMSPGSTHRPMFDAEGNYPWHQYETITPSIFMAIELMPQAPVE